MPFFFLILSQYRLFLLPVIVSDLNKSYKRATEFTASAAQHQRRLCAGAGMASKYTWRVAVGRRRRIGTALAFRVSQHNQRLSRKQVDTGNINTRECQKEPLILILSVYFCNGTWHKRSPAFSFSSSWTLGGGGGLRVISNCAHLWGHLNCIQNTTT